MGIFSFEGRRPVIHEGSYIFPSAAVIGKVTIGEGVWVGPGAAIRGDYGEIIIGGHTAVEENCVIHARPGEKTVIGEHVTLGHGCIVHTGTVADWAIIGMGAIVSDFAKVGRWAAIGEGAVVKNRADIPEDSIAVGVPAKVVGKVDEEYKKVWTEYKWNYNSFCERYTKNLREEI